MFFIKDLNHCMGDSNRWLSASLFSSPRIWISWLEIRIDQSQQPYWNLDSNRFMRDSNRLCQSELPRIGIQIAIWGIWIIFFEFAWKAPELKDYLRDSNLNIKKMVLSVHLWRLANVYLFSSWKHLLSLISKINISVLVSSKSTRVQQELYCDWFSDEICWENICICCLEECLVFFPNWGK